MSITTWIVSANASRARIFCETQPNQPLVEVEDMVNDAARLDAGEAETDRLGMVAAGQSRHGTGGARPNSTYQPAMTPAQHASADFARHLCACLERAHNEGRFDQLVLVASPAFLGELRQHMGRTLERLVTRELDKDYTEVSAQQLRAQIGPYAHHR
jgi:protein required for attachment to host cells